MTIKTEKLLILALSLLLPGACTSGKEAGMPPPHFGSAVEQNIAAQTVNPDAGSSYEPLVYDGARAAVAQGRYVTDKVEKPEKVKTSSASKSSGK